jgi:multiple sugar transport system permease protein
MSQVAAVRPSALSRGLRSATPYFFLIPALLLVGTFLLYPFARSAYLSFTDFKGIGDPVWVGIDNYRRLANDPVLSRTLTNTMLWVIGTLILPVGLGLLIAVLSWNAKAGSLFRLPFLIPYALSGTAIATVWQFMLVRDGALNSVLEAVGLGSLARPWLLEPPLNTWSMIIASTWQAVGVSVLLFIIGLQVIPPEPIQAARIDGAEGWRLFRDMTLPMLAPMTIVVVGISLVNSLKTFDIVWIMTQGGPFRSSETLAVMMYRETFVLFRFGYGAAIAVLLSVIVFGVSFFYLSRTLRNT